jgi:hypothetical protein
VEILVEFVVIALLVLTCLVAVAGIGMFVEMYRRDQPLLGAGGLGVLMFAGVLASVYGTLDTV